MPFSVSENPEETPKPFKKCFTFAPFQPFSPSFGAIEVLRSCRSCADAISLSGPRGMRERQPRCPCCRWSRCSRGNQSRTEAGKPSTTQQNEEHNRTSRHDGAGVLPMLPANRERKPTRKEGTRERKRKKGSDKPTSPQAHKPTKKGVPPPIGREQAAFPLITNSRQKISKKSPWVVLKKISEKFFVGMFRGKEKPLALSQRKGRSYNKS